MGSISSCDDGTWIILRGDRCRPSRAFRTGRMTMGPIRALYLSVARLLFSGRKRQRALPGRAAGDWIETAIEQFELEMNDHLER